MATMPNVIGLEYPAALEAMFNAGVRLLPLGYFQTDPVTIAWAANTGITPGCVVAQSPAPGTSVSGNSNVFLEVANFPLGVAYPAGGVETDAWGVAPIGGGGGGGGGVPQRFDIGQFDISGFDL
jgi:beta-lactam-binding protein with PASTA domain